MAKIGGAKPNSQFTAVEYKEKHEKSLQEKEALIERDQAARVALAEAKALAEETYKQNPTKANYRRMKAAAIRTV